MIPEKWIRKDHAQTKSYSAMAIYSERIALCADHLTFPRSHFVLEFYPHIGVTRAGGTAAPRRKQEARMTRFAIRLVTLTVFAGCVIATAPTIPVFAAGNEDIMRPSGSAQSPPATRSSHRTKKANKQSFLSDPAFVQGYRAAYATIYDRNDYTAAIEQLKALGHDDYANVANLIGYSYRKLGDYKLSQVWYERALKSDPDHVLTWNYYGLWQIEQGNREQAEYHLTRIAAICGTDCDEYRTLAEALEKPPGTALVY
jgi:tetratricopeptide (TPR) repeat protein